MNRDSPTRATDLFGHERLLSDSWDEACLPLRDERPEVIAWYEERLTEARNSLMEFRKRCKGKRVRR
jgi:hypothetical protein